MTDGIMLQISDDGKATLYESTYDITIHCESEKEQHEVMKRLNSMSWIPCSERLPKENGFYLTSTTYGEVYLDAWNGINWERSEEILAWMPLPEPYKEGEQDD